MSTVIQTVHLPYPYPLQAAIVSDPTRFKIVATGRRSGKTTLGIYRTSRVALDYGVLCWWVAPTNQAAYLAWERFKEALAGIADVSETRKRIVLPGGGEIWLKSAEEPDNLRGEGVDDLTLDEAAHIKKLSYVWRAVLRPMLIDSGGDMLALSTPNRRNLFYQWFVRGQDPAQTEWKSWNFPTTANPYLPAAEFDQLEQEYPPGSELYRQEILGEFLESSGAVFRKVRDCATAKPDGQPIAGHRYVAGIDWGKSRDFTVIAVMDADTGEQVAMDRFNVVDYTLQRARLAALCERWDVDVVLAETNAMGEPNLEMLRADGLKQVRGFATTARSKRPLIEGLAQAFEVGAISILNDPVLIGELEAYERKESPNTGASTYSAPDGMHDDCVIALALAWSAANKPRPEDLIMFVELD